jgi:hypothetical protein
MTTETWKTVPGHEHLMISDSGLVFVCERISKSIRTRNGIEQTFTSIHKARLVPSYLTKTGYKEIAVQINNKRKKYLVHRLVGLAFINGYDSDLTINHLDGNKQNNHISNLEWISLADNTKHQWKTGLVNLRGENSPTAKLTYQKVKIIRNLLILGASAHSLAVLSGVSDKIIHGIANGTRWHEI